MPRPPIIYIPAADVMKESEFLVKILEVQRRAAYTMAVVGSLCV